MTDRRGTCIAQMNLRDRELGLRVPLRLTIAKLTGPSTAVTGNGVDAPQIDQGNVTSAASDRVMDPLFDHQLYLSSVVDGLLCLHSI